MFTCQFCGAPATVHLTKIVNLKKHDMHLCDRCEKQQNLIPSSPSPQINLPILLQLLVAQTPTGPNQETDEVDPGSLTCPACGLKYAQFRSDGRLGCPEDYDIFRLVLEPLLEKVHRGIEHVGKVPTAIHRQRKALELADLQEQLRSAIASENYEEAARLRDRIRQKDVTG